MKTRKLFGINFVGRWNLDYNCFYDTYATFDYGVFEDRTDAERKAKELNEELIASGDAHRGFDDADENFNFYEVTTLKLICKENPKHKNRHQHF